MDIALAHAELQGNVKIVMPLEHKWYGSPSSRSRIRTAT